MLPGLDCAGVDGGIAGILYVGYAFSTSGSASLLSLNPGTLGIGGDAQPGDYVLVACTFDATSDINFSLTGYTELADLYSNASGGTDGNLGVYIKKMTSTPDTTVAMPTNASKFFALVFRGVDQTTPTDATTTTATGTGATQPDCPAITTVTPNALVIAIPMDSSGDTAHGYGGISGYTGGVFFNGGTGANLYLAGVTKLVTTPGVENPPAVSGLVVASGDAWCAATVALRPA